MKPRLRPASNRLVLSSAAKAGLVLVALVLATTSGCKQPSRSEIRCETADALQQQSDDMRSLREVDPSLVKYEQIDVIETGLQEPRGIAVQGGPHPALYVVGDRRLRVFDDTGFCGYDHQFPEAVYAMALADDGCSYIGFRKRIAAYNYRPQLQSQWTLPGEDAYLTCLAVSGAEVWAADAGNRMVLHYTKSGELLGKIGEPDESSDTAQFIVPSPHFDVLLKGEDELLITNPGRRRVETYNKDGELQSYWGKAAQNLAGFCGCCNPTDIAVLPDGRVVTAEKGLPRVKVYSPDGKFDCVVATPDDFSARAVGLDLAVSADGRVFVLEPAAAVVHVFAEKTQKGAEQG